jgi:hypothetical protein
VRSAAESSLRTIFPFVQLYGERTTLMLVVQGERELCIDPATACASREQRCFGPASCFDRC